MRKVLLFCFICLLLCTGCLSTDSKDEIKLEKYAYIYQTISDNDSFGSSAKYYDLSVVMSKLEEGGYRYDIILDNPRIAMYGIQVMAVENNIEYSMANKMMPTIGVLDDDVYHMVPYQVDASRGYVKGLILSGVTDNPVVNLKIRISWKDYLMVVESKEYYSVTVDYDTQVAENTPETPTPDETTDNDTTES